MSFLNSRDALAPRGIGKSVPRREDLRLLTGRGQYAADFSLPNQAYACLLRSPHAHALIMRIDTSAATGGPDVLAVALCGCMSTPIPICPSPSAIKQRG